MIGIIDSGIGGKGIEAEIKKLLPNVKIEYLADTKNFPYGTKPVKVLHEILSKNIETMIGKGINIIVLACNSATVSSVSYLRKRFPDIEIVGVVPAIKTAAKVTKTKKIAIFSTPITSKSKAQQDLIDKYCLGIEVYKIPFFDLAGLIEQGKTSSSTLEVEEQWSKYKDKNIDTVVLGCTHYTLIKPEFQKIVGKNVKLVDSNSAVAEQVKKVYNTSNLKVKSQS
jgi:glutamate racemase